MNILAIIFNGYDDQLDEQFLIDSFESFSLIEQEECNIKFKREIARYKNYVLWYDFGADYYFIEVSE